MNKVKVLNEEKEKIKKYRLIKLNKVMLGMQAFMTVIFLIVLIIELFQRKTFAYVELIGGLLLILMAYNNKMTYKRNKLTVMYAVFGILVIATGILELMGII